MTDTTPVLAVSIEDAARAVGVSASTVRRMIIGGQVAATRIGRRQVIPAEELRRLVEQGTEGGEVCAPNP